MKKLFGKAKRVLIAFLVFIFALSLVSPALADNLGISIGATMTSSDNHENLFYGNAKGSSYGNLLKLQYNGNGTDRFVVDRNGLVTAAGDVCGNGKCLSTSASQWSGTNPIYYNTGNVGIGTNNPSVAGGSYAGLDIRGTNGGSVAVGTPSTLAGYFYGGTWGTALDTTVNGYMTFATNDTERMRILAGGNVGIGTASPGFKFQVSGDVSASGGWLRTTGSQGVYWDSYDTRIYSDSSSYIKTRSDAGWVFYDRSTNLKGYVYSDSSYNFGLLGNNGSWAVRIPNGSSDVYLGGNTYSNGNVTASGYFYTPTYNNGQIFLNSQGTYYGNISNPSSQVWSLGYGSMGSTGNPVLSWNASGNVGIGTTGPGAKLQISNSYPLVIGSDGLLKIKSLPTANGSETVSLQTSIDDRTDDYTISGYGGDARHLLVLQPQGGYVGIGTTNPGYKLDVEASGGTAIYGNGPGTGVLGSGSIGVMGNGTNRDFSSGGSGSYGFYESGSAPNYFGGSITYPDRMMTYLASSNAGSGRWAHFASVTINNAYENDHFEWVLKNRYYGGRLFLYLSSGSPSSNNYLNDFTYNGDYGSSPQLAVYHSSTYTWDVYIYEDGWSATYYSQLFTNMSAGSSVGSIAYYSDNYSNPPGGYTSPTYNYFGSSVGIGTASPAARLEVDAPAGSTGIRVISGGTSAYFQGIYGLVSNSSYVGVTASGDSIGVQGSGDIAVQANGISYDFYGSSGNPNYFAGKVGIGTTASAKLDVYTGDFAATGLNVVADGQFDTAANFNGNYFGVYSTGGVYDFYGNGNSYFGNLNKGEGSFLIDNPLNPKNETLQHSFVESPEMRNLYYGQAQTVDGEIEITLPEWWTALNGKDEAEYNYLMSPIGKWCNLYVSKEIENNKFTIASSNGDCKFSWQVSAIRHDKFAEDNRIPVVKEKAADKKGICIYPKACE